MTARIHKVEESVYEADFTIEPTEDADAHDRVRQALRDRGRGARVVGADGRKTRAIDVAEIDLDPWLTGSKFLESYNEGVLRPVGN